MISPFVPASLLLPQVENPSLWACVACDQYTSEPEYWKRADARVGGAPSALRLVLPELYLSTPEAPALEQEVVRTMEDYLARGVFREVTDSFVLLSRTLRNGAVRRGLVGMLDLECYDYAAGSLPPVRATEGTVLSRIPPRLRIRAEAPLELPHVLLLMDDPEDGVLSLAESLAGEALYDFDLAENSGHVLGRRIAGENAAALVQKIDALAEPSRINALYGLPAQSVMHLAVGDGNHSLATAKAHYEKLKAELGEAALSSPARYALCELVNLRESSLVFEPIHRVLFDCDPAQILREFAAFCGARPGRSSGQSLRIVAEGEATDYTIPNPTEPLCVGSVQAFLDSVLARGDARVDYIHGDEVVRSLCRAPRTLGFLLPPMGKEELFPAVALRGVLPRKTFSMGEACDKRFYIEARKIR